MSEKSQKPALFSFKIIIHRICLTKFAFKETPPVILKPGFKVKFVDFPHLLILSRFSLYLEDFKEQIDPLTGKPKEELKAFGKGKSAYFNSTYEDMIEFFEKYSLIIQFKDFQHDKHKLIGTTLLNLHMFSKDIKYIVSDDLERFKRNSFRITDKDNNCVGWLDMSISILQRPKAYSQLVISKKLGVQDPATIMQKEYYKKAQSPRSSNNSEQKKEISTFGKQDASKQSTKKVDFKLNQQKKGNTNDDEEIEEYSADFESSVANQSSSVTQVKRSSFQKFQNKNQSDQFNESESFQFKESLGQQSEFTNSQFEPKSNKHQLQESITENYLDDEFEDLSISKGTESMMSNQYQPNSISMKHSQGGKSRNKQTNESKLSESQSYYEDFESAGESMNVGQGKQKETFQVRSVIDKEIEEALSDDQNFQEGEQSQFQGDQSQYQGEQSQFQESSQYQGEQSQEQGNYYSDKEEDEEPEKEEEEESQSF